MSAFFVLSGCGLQWSTKLAQSEQEEYKGFGGGRMRYTAVHQTLY